MSYSTADLSLTTGLRQRNVGGLEQQDGVNSRGVAQGKGAQARATGTEQVNVAQGAARLAERSVFTCGSLAKAVGAFVVMTVFFGCFFTPNGLSTFDAFKTGLFTGLAAGIVSVVYYAFTGKSEDNDLGLSIDEQKALIPAAVQWIVENRKKQGINLNKELTEKEMLEAMAAVAKSQSSVNVGALPADVATAKEAVVPSVAVKEEKLRATDFKQYTKNVFSRDLINECLKNESNIAALADLEKGIVVHDGVTFKLIKKDGAYMNFECIKGDIKANYVAQGLTVRNGFQVLDCFANETELKKWLSNEASLQKVKCGELPFKCLALNGSVYMVTTGTNAIQLTGCYDVCGRVLTIKFSELQLKAADQRPFPIPAHKPNLVSSSTRISTSVVAPEAAASSNFGPMYDIQAFIDDTEKVNEMIRAKSINMAGTTFSLKGGVDGKYVCFECEKGSIKREYAAVYDTRRYSLVDQCLTNKQELESWLKNGNGKDVRRIGLAGHIYGLTFSRDSKEVTCQGFYDKVKDCFTIKL